MISYSDKIAIGWSRYLLPLEEQVHIHCFNIYQEHLLEEKSFLITSEEQEKYFSFRRREDGARFLAGRIYTKQLLARYLDIRADAIFIRQGKNKKPLAMGIAGDLLPLSFNISHSGHWVLVSVCNKETGVDVEEMLPIDRSDLLYEVFSEKERSYIGEGTASTKRFYKLWTRKEAVLKAAGTGMIDNLKQLEVLDEPGNTITEDLSEVNFDVLSFDVAADYMASVCFPTGTEAGFFLLPHDCL